MNRAKTSAIVALLLSIAPAAYAQDEYAEVHTVAIASAINADLTIPGGMFFSSPPVDVHTGWDLQPVFERRIADLLGGRFKIRTGIVPASAFADILPGLFGNYWHEMSDRVRAQPKDNDIDAYIVAMPDDPPSTDQPWGNIYFEHHVNRYTGGTTFIRMPFVISVYDAKTGDRMDYGTAKYPRTDLRFPVSIECDESL